MSIKITTRDGSKQPKTRTYKTIDGARKAAVRAVTEHPIADKRQTVVHPETGLKLWAHGIPRWVLFPEEFPQRGGRGSLDEEHLKSYWVKTFRVTREQAAYMNPEMAKTIRRKCSRGEWILSSCDAQNYISRLIELSEILTQLKKEVVLAQKAQKRNSLYYTYKYIVRSQETLSRFYKRLWGMKCSRHVKWCAELYADFMMVVEWFISSLSNRDDLIAKMSGTRS